MRIVLWDTRKRDVNKDFAGGFGVGKYHGGGDLRGKLIQWMYRRDHRPVAMAMAYLAASFKQQGHQVEYALDEIPKGADVYVFHPALMTLDLEHAAMKQALATGHHVKVLVTGSETENLHWRLDEVLEAGPGVVDIGSVKDLDALPWPDWSLFEPQKFRVGYDFWKFPTGYIQQSRGCTLKCNYCPYIMVESKTRFRDPEQVVAEMRHGMQKYGFKSFKFRDPLWGLDRKRVLRLAQLIGNLPKKVQFSIESRIDILKPDILRLLKGVGLTSITVGIETPDEGTLKHHKRAPIKDDLQREWVALCRSMGIRTVAGFMIGFPTDTKADIRGVLHYAQEVGPTYANFNVCTPYPGTEWFTQVQDQIADFDFSKYSVYTPVLKYEHLTAEEVHQEHTKCFQRYYFNWKYLYDNAHLLVPGLQKLGIGSWHKAPESNPKPSVVPKPHVSTGEACDATPSVVPLSIKDRK